MNSIDIVSDIKYSEIDDCLADIYPVTDARRTLVWFHGGGLTGGSKSEDEKFLLEAASRLNISIVSAEYRKYPRAKFPEFIEDAAAAVYWTFEKAKKYGLGDEIFAGGNSAGAYLAMMLLFADSYLGKYGLKPTDLKGFIFDSPQPTDHFNVLAERGTDPRKVIISDASPLFYAEEKECPPFFLTSYDHDMFGRLEQNEMACKLFEALRLPFTFVRLGGAHCSGLHLNGDGEYSLIAPVENWLKTLK